LEEKREPTTGIDIAVVDSLKVLDPGRPIRNADIAGSTLLANGDVTLMPTALSKSGQFALVIEAPAGAQNAWTSARFTIKL
jgi:hypothetical protein